MLSGFGIGIKSLTSLESTTSDYFNTFKSYSGEQMELRIKTNYDASPILFVMSKGKVVQSRPLDINKAEMVENVEITSQMIPEARFLVLEKLENGWTADSLSYFVQEDFENSVTLEVNIDYTFIEIDKPNFFYTSGR